MPRGITNKLCADCRQVRMYGVPGTRKYCDACQEKRRSKHGGYRAGAGRPPISMEKRKLFAGKIRIHVAPDNALLAQRLMLHFPDVPTVEALYELAMTRLARATDD